MSTNPDDLPGLVCAPTPVYVTGNIHARWGGGGGFKGDLYKGTIDHAYAVENIFTPSPSTKWKTDSSIKGTSGIGHKNMSADTLILAADAAVTAGSTKNNIRDTSTELVAYGLQDRCVLVDASYKSDFRESQTVTYRLSSLLTQVTISSVQDNVVRYLDPASATRSTGYFKENELAGKYIGWNQQVDGQIVSRTAKILTNRHDESSGTNRGTIVIDPMNLSPGMCMHDSNVYSYGLGQGAGLTADVFGDRASIDLFSSVNRVRKPSGYAGTTSSRGWSFYRFRFPGWDRESGTGISTGFGARGYHTIDGEHTIGTLVLGVGVTLDVPFNWTHTDTTKPNIKITTAPSGQKQSYKMAAPRRTVAVSMPGDVSDFRFKLQNLFNNHVDYTKKPVALLLNSADEVMGRNSTRFNMLARFDGSFTNANVGWRRDENNVWIPIGDTTFSFVEEL